MKTNPTNVVPDYASLQANLYLLASDFESLKNYLTGYSDDGIYSECLEGIREPMAGFSGMIQSGKLSLPAIAKIFECYYQMESLARHPYATNAVDAFKNSEPWQNVKHLAKLAADALDGIS